MHKLTFTGQTNHACVLVMTAVGHLPSITGAVLKCILNILLYIVVNDWKSLGVLTDNKFIEIAANIVHYIKSVVYEGCTRWSIWQAEY